jgi:signal transduction histidine kinase
MEPLLERHRPQFEKRKIKIDSHFESVPVEQITLFVDKGLISQVFDNFLTNAIKYAQQVEDQFGHRIKLLSYSREILKDYFGEGIHGIRFNFFTTGKPLSLEESRKVFEEGYRATGSAQERGSGHGLHFVSNVVEIHGGKVGCKPQRFGNLFYFILPMKDEKPVQE